MFEPFKKILRNIKFPHYFSVNVDKEYFFYKKYKFIYMKTS